MNDDKPQEWHLPINQGAWHLAVTPDGLLKIRPYQGLPASSARLYPGKLHAWVYFRVDGPLRPEYSDIQIYRGPRG